MNKRTAYEYYIRLMNFQNFITIDYKTTLDTLIMGIKEGNEDPYDVLTDYITYLQNTCDISPNTLKARTITAKNFLEYDDVDISPRKFNLKIKMPKVIKKSKEALSKEDVIDILNASSDIRLKTYVMLLAATGFRAVEALSIRIKDLHLETQPTRIFVSNLSWYKMPRFNLRRNMREAIYYGHKIIPIWPVLRKTTTVSRSARFMIKLVKIIQSYQMYLQSLGNSIYKQSQVYSKNI